MTVWSMGGLWINNNAARKVPCTVCWILIYIFCSVQKLETDSGKLGEFWNWSEAADALERGMESWKCLIN